MTPNISQHVTPRQRRQNSRFSYSLRQKKGSPIWQQGSINSTTITLGLGVIIISSVAFLSFFYLGQVLNTASQGTDIQTLEERIVELKEQQREVELEGAHLRSIDNIEDRIDQLSLISTNRVSFLKTTTDKVAAVSN